MKYVKFETLSGIEMFPKSSALPTFLFVSAESEWSVHRSIEGTTMQWAVARRESRFERESEECESEGEVSRRVYSSSPSRVSVKT